VPGRGKPLACNPRGRREQPNTLSGLIATLRARRKRPPQNVSVAPAAECPHRRVRAARDRVASRRKLCDGHPPAIGA